MKMVFKCGVVLHFLLIGYMSQAQGTYAPPNIPDKAQKQLQEAVLQYQGGQQAEGQSSIEDLIKRYPTWTAPRIELSRLLYASRKKEEAARQLEASLTIDTASQLQELFTLGRIYEEINQPERALNCYKAVVAKKPIDEKLLTKANNSVKTLSDKKALWQSAPVIPFTSFDDDINTPHHESLGRWTLDGQQMVFTRLVFDQEDIFFASFDTVAGLWKIEDFPHNTPQNEGAHAVSPDGKYIIFTSCNRQDTYGSCDLYLSFKQNGQWSAPVNMGPAFNSISWDGQPCFGLDGLTLFFASSRPGGKGGRDIWYVYQIGPGKWSNPVNAGDAINTANNEESPFIHFDGQTMYFMRDGQDGLGGYDLYMSKRNITGKWETPVNLGAPINTGGDEGALTLHPDGVHAILTRMTETNKNDLFSFEMPQQFRSAHLQALRASITDLQTGAPVRARLEIFETDQKDTVRYSQWTDPEGNIAAVTAKGKTYGVIVSAEGYMLHSTHLDADTSATRHIHISLIPVAAAGEKVITLENIFFETGSSVLLPASDPELNKLVWTLRNNKEMKIEIRGHTDNVGDATTNQALSEDRAKAVYQYLVGRGVDASRLTYIGFGETQPVAENSTAEGRRKNRRTEFRIIQM